MIRLAQGLLALSALALWVASRLPWVEISSADGLGQPKTTTLNGAEWSTALIPLALVLLAAAVVALAVRGGLLRAVAVLVAVSSAGIGYLGVSQWAVNDISVRGAGLAEVPVVALVGSQRHYWGAATAVLAAVIALLAAVILMRSAGTAKGAGTRYAAPAARREAVRKETASEPAQMSERMMWDALDEGSDPTREGPDKSADPDNKGR
ncbi:TIGR02234 family membrane protein [Mycobacterium sp. NPDC003323]